MESAPEPAEVELKKLTIYVPPDVHAALKLEAVQRQMTMGAVIVEALQTRGRLIKGTGR